MMAYAYVIGFLAQIFFSARTLLQWILSEKTKKVVSPSLFWVLSLLGSYLMFVYGWVRNDFSILFGQLITYYVYIWNLHEKGLWNRFHVLFKLVLLLTPVVAILFVCGEANEFIKLFFKNDKIPFWMLIFGSLGQLIFTLRFIYQFFYSVKRKESILPMGFWVLSLLGSAIIIVYGFLRKDIVLIVGQPFGLVAYIRNIMIELSSHQPSDSEI